MDRGQVGLSLVLLVLIAVGVALLVFGWAPR
jgi:hypothetical protein